MISKDTALSLLESYFKDTSDDFITAEQMYELKDRTHLNATTNRKWLTGVKAKLQYHNLVETIPDYSDRKRVVGIRLTPFGKAQLKQRREREISEEGGDMNATSVINQNSEDLSLDKLLTAIEKLRSTHPSFEIVFSIKQREETAQ